MCLNRPETIPSPPTQSVEKLSSTKPVPGANEVGERCLTLFLFLSEIFFLFLILKQSICELKGEKYCFLSQY